jgi:hypothetical protein
MSKYNHIAVFFGRLAFHDLEFNNVKSRTYYHGFNAKGFEMAKYDNYVNLYCKVFYFREQ